MSEKGVIKKSTVEAICNAIRSKDGSTEPIPINTLADRITALNTDSEEIPTQEKTVDITENGTVEVTADEGYTLSKVTANVNVASSGGDSGNDKLKKMVDVSITEVTAQDLEGLERIGNYAFYYRFNLTRVTLPNSLKSIGNYAFEQCNNITSINFPDSVTSIGSSAFNNCEKITSITIPDSVTSMNSSVFRYCKALTDVTIGKGVSTMSTFAFADCTKIKSFTILAENPPSIQSSTFKNLPTTCVFRVYNLSKYREATNWSTMMDTYTFEEIEE